jgi:hypothetical protein
MVDDAGEEATKKNEPRYETLRFEYEEICRSHQAIADFRAKLLALLPLASGTGIFLLLNSNLGTNASLPLVAAGLFGTAVTLGLYFYEQRGMDECLLLRGRGTNLEKKLHLSADIARFLDNTPGFVGPQGAGPIVYFAVIAAWLFVAVYGLSSVHGFSRLRPPLEVVLGAVIVAAYLIALLIAAIRRGSMKITSEEGLLRDENKRWAFWIVLILGGFLFILLSYAVPHWLVGANLGVTKDNVGDISNALVGFFTLIVPVLIGSDAHVRHGKLAHQQRDNDKHANGGVEVRAQPV